MSESKHTPGPWAVQRHAETGFRFETYTVGPPGNLLDIAAIQNRSRDEVAEANARLIAAAPDLLDALQGLYEVAEGATPDAITKAEAALRKARGK